MEPTNHLLDLQLLIVEIEEDCASLDDRPALDFNAANPAILAERRPTTLESKFDPNLIGYIFGIVRKMISDEMDSPPQIIELAGNILP